MKISRAAIRWRAPALALALLACAAVAAAHVGSAALSPRRLHVDAQPIAGGH